MKVKVEDKLKSLDDMLKLKKEFYDIFDTPLTNFVGFLGKVLKIWDFDIIKLDDWMHKRYQYEEEKDGSLMNFIEKRFGKEGVNLINKLLEKEVRNYDKKG